MGNLEFIPSFCFGHVNTLHFRKLLEGVVIISECFAARACEDGVVPGQKARLVNFVEGRVEILRLCIGIVVGVGHGVSLHRIYLVQTVPAVDTLQLLGLERVDKEVAVGGVLQRGQRGQ